MRLDFRCSRQTRRADAPPSYSSRLEQTKKKDYRKVHGKQITADDDDTPCWPEQFAYGASTTLSISRIVCLEPGRCLIYHCNQSFYAALMLSFGGIDCRQLRQTKKRFYGKRKQSDAKKSALTHTHTEKPARIPSAVMGEWFSRFTRRALGRGK